MKSHQTKKQLHVATMCKHFAILCTMLCYYVMVRLLILLRLR